MDPVNPWLDADEVRRMALRLIKPVRETAANIADAGFDEAFVGFTHARPACAAGPQVLQPEPAPQPVPSPEPEPERVPQPVSPLEPPQLELEDEEPSASAARGPFLERICGFLDWLKREFSASGVFILDREGSVIFDESDHGRLHFLARSLALASRRPGASAANVHVKIGAGTTLEVIPVETAYGCLVLGAVVPESLPPASVSAVMAALAQVAAPPGETLS